VNQTLAGIIFLTGSLLLPDGSVLDDGALRIEDGIITALGTKVDLEAAGAARDARAIDRAGRWIAPGFVSPLARTGCEPEADESYTSISPEILAVEAVDPWSEALANAARGGLAVAGIAPGAGNVLGGWVGALAIGDGPLASEVLDPRAALRASLDASRFVPQRMPASLPGAVSILRRAIAIAMDRPPGADPKADAIAPAARGERAIFIEARTAGEIDAALRIRAASGAIRLVIAGADDAEDRLDAIRDAGAAVILDPLGPASSARALRAPAALESRGIPFAFAADAPEELRWSIALARLHGTSRRACLAAATETPARLLGIGDRFGAIAAGRRAHLIVFDGDPLALSSRIVEVLRGGAPRKEEKP